MSDGASSHVTDSKSLVKLLLQRVSPYYLLRETSCIKPVLWPGSQPNNLMHSWWAPETPATPLFLSLLLFRLPNSWLIGCSGPGQNDGFSVYSTDAALQIAVGTRTGSLVTSMKKKKGLESFVTAAVGKTSRISPLLCSVTKLTAVATSDHSHFKLLTGLVINFASNASRTSCKRSKMSNYDNRVVSLCSGRKQNYFSVLVGWGMYKPQQCRS